MSCGFTERASSTPAAVPSVSSGSIATSNLGAIGTSFGSGSQHSRCGGSAGPEGNSLSTLATSPSSRASGSGDFDSIAGVAGSPPNGSQSASPAGSQLRTKHCSTLLFCCCCKCPWFNHDNKNEENGTANNSISDLDRCVSSGAMEEVLVTMDDLRNWGKSFDKLMLSIAGRKIFRSFLIGEYSEENILFWLACEDFKKHSDKAFIERKSRLIYMHYIHPDSTTEVSLDSRVRDIVKRQLQDPQPTMYDEAQLQIYTLMQRDSYPRFINSQMFKNLVLQTEKKGGDKFSFWIQPQKTPSLASMDLNSPTFIGGDNGHGSQSTPLLTAIHPAAITPMPDFLDRDQDSH